VSTTAAVSSGEHTITVSGYGAAKSFPYTLEAGVVGKPHAMPPQGLIPHPYPHAPSACRTLTIWPRW
jgi:hypothetical protein